MAQTRDRWPSRTFFIFATVGSAVGLGNVWRFPYLVGKYGGGAFLLPYVLILLLIGFPLLVMEFALGQKMQKGAVGSFRKIDPSLSGVGLGTILNCVGVSAYYAVIMGWCIIYACYSFTLPWASDAKAFFFDQILHVSSGPNEVIGFAPLVLAALVASWVLVYFCLWKGVKGVSQVVAITMPSSVVATFIIMYIVGFTINMMSLMGLAMTVGVLVNNAILVLENITRYLHLGHSPQEAATKGRINAGPQASQIPAISSGEGGQGGLRGR